MWDQGGQPWPQWPLSQQQWMQSFQHQHDPGQVDWAALAQAWIAQKESTGAEPEIEPNGQDIPGLEPPAQGNHGSFQGDPAFGRMWQPEWGVHGQPPPRRPPPPPPPPLPPPEQTWIPPGPAPMDVVNPSEDSNSQDSAEFNSEAHRGVFPQNSHGYGAQPDSYDMAPMAMNQFDYQHGAASSFAPPPSSFHSPYWPGPPQNRRDARPPGFRDRPRSPVRLPLKQEAPAPLDAVKRRTLPAWIREGLEKRDRDIQKKLEQERMEKERAEMSKDGGEEHNVDDGDGPHIPRKSKFDSDDEDNYEEKPPVQKEFFVRSPSPPAEESEPEMTEEEKEFQLMIITKTLLTEILLEVTNEEIQHVAKEVHRKATRGGLGEYGSEESADEDDHSGRGSESSDTDEEELRHRIREKQDAFLRKEREMQQHQEKLAQDAQLAREEMLRERLSRERGEYEEVPLENSHQKEEREAEPFVERRRSRSEMESSEGRNSGRSKERSGRGGSSSPANGHSSSSRSSSSHSSSRTSSSSSTSSSRSSTRSSSPRRKRRRSRSSSYKNHRRSRSHSSHRRRSEKVRDRRRSSTDRKTGHRKKDRSNSRERRSRRSRSKSRDRGRARARESRSRSRDRDKDRDKDRDRDKERKRSRERRDGSHSRKHKPKASSKDRERKRDRSHSPDKDKKRKDKDRERDSDRKRDKARTKEKSNSLVNDENGKSKKPKEVDCYADSQSDKHSRQDSKSSKKGSAKASKKLYDSDSSRSPTPEVSKEKKSKKSKRSRSRSTEKSHKSGKKASRKHKSKSRSRSTTPSHRSRR
uniref:arginine/serine-rich protein PNISR isoform X2 n=1 Tax=Doryrhamphus excisus TaxID=161450 RepID=UPI0025AEC59D|nr:arginine/serine-rich protein PNISR isoform X2 [Doryrhamphus excisus]